MRTARPCAAARWDFFSLSYYQTNCVTVDPNAAQASGNLLGGAKNPYLESSQLKLAESTRRPALHPSNEIESRYRSARHHRGERPGCPGRAGS